MNKNGIASLIIDIIIGKLILVFFATLLWNYLMPVIFGLPKLTYWQTFLLQTLVGCFITNSYHFKK